MVWVIVVVAVVLLALAAWAGTGRLGEMPEVVNDRPKGRIPEGEVDAEFLEGLSLPLAPTGYSPQEVDEYLDRVVAGDAEPATEVRFATVRRGYDMQLVDQILDRVPGAHAARRAASEDVADDEHVAHDADEDVADDAGDEEAVIDVGEPAEESVVTVEEQGIPADESGDDVEEPGEGRNAVDEESGTHRIVP